MSYLIWSSYLLPQHLLHSAGGLGAILGLTRVTYCAPFLNKSSRITLLIYQGNVRELLCTICAV